MEKIAKKLTKIGVGEVYAPDVYIVIGHYHTVTTATFVPRPIDEIEAEYASLVENYRSHPNPKLRALVGETLVSGREVVAAVKAASSP